MASCGLNVRAVCWSECWAHVFMPECLVRVSARMLGLNVEVCVDHCRKVCVIGKWSRCIYVCHGRSSVWRLHYQFFINFLVELFTVACTTDDAPKYDEVSLGKVACIIQEHHMLSLPRADYKRAHEALTGGL